MIIYFKCSFRSSHGFTMSRYDIENKQLSFLSEKSSSSDKLIPKTVEYTLSHQLGRCLVLATDENGHYFFGIYRLIEGNDDKYVNAVFYDNSDQNRILSLYDYFCNNQYDATKHLVDSVRRIEETSYNDTNLEYSIDSHQIDFIVPDAYVNVVNKKTKACSPNTLLAFITTDKYSDYQIILEEIFNVRKMFLYENFDVNNNQIINYQLDTKTAFKNLFPFYISLPIAIGGGIGIIGLIVKLLDMFL